MNPRLVKMTVGGAVRVVDLLAHQGGTLISGNFQSYRPAGSAFSAYTGMWGTYLPQNDQLVADSTMRVYDTFPAGTVLAWDITPDPDYDGINGYLHIDYGNYDESPGAITPRQVDAITSLSLNVGWTFTGSNTSGLLTECWLAAQSAASGAFTKTHEVGFLPKVSTSAVGWLAGLPAVGSGSFTSAGVNWDVREASDASGALPYLIAYRPGYVDHQGVFPYRDLFAFLKTSGKITGSEWFNGLAFGAEPHSGAGSLTVDTFAVTYA